MAERKVATLLAAEPLGENTKLLSFRMGEGELGFAGGQYLIVDTGILIAGGKIAKRAYSIISADRQQGEFQLAVRRIGSGPGSNFMHGLQPGASLGFSGPWGKFVAGENMHKDPLVFATDTGITAALGLLRGQAPSSWGSSSRLVWFAESDCYFLPFHFVIGELDSTGVKNLAIAEAPPVAHPQRTQKALAIVERAIAEVMPRSAFLSGDGAVVYAVRSRLIAAGLSADNIHIECFFNNPQRRVAA
jgi:ferredoxin-NADP reductase